MGVAARAIIIEDGHMLLMHRNKYGSEYFTLVGGQLREGETPEQALVREVQEETGLTVKAARLVYFENHAAPYNQQYIYFCHVAPHGEIAVEESSEEGVMNRFQLNTHTPQWVSLQAFPTLPFRTPQLHAAITQALTKGFPEAPLRLA